MFGLGPESDAGAWSSAAGAAGALVGGGAADLFDEQGVESAPRIETRDAGEAAVDHRADAVDGERGFGDVGGDDDFRAVVAGDGGVLVAGLQFAVEREEQVTAGFGKVPQGFEGALDLERAGHEHQNIAGIASAGLVGESLGGLVPDGTFIGVAVLFREFDFDGERAAFGGDGAAGVEVGLQLFCLERGGHHHQPEIGTMPFLEFQGTGEGDVAVEMPFVEFVEDQGRDPGQQRIVEHLPEQDAFRDEFDAGGGAGDPFEADLVADLASERASHFLGDPAGEQSRGEPAWLQHDHLAVPQQAVPEQDLGDLGGFTGAGGGGQHQAVAGPETIHDGGFDVVDRESPGHFTTGLPAASQPFRPSSR